MLRNRMHAKRELTYDTQTVGIAWTRCYRNVEQSQIAAFREGVTCKNCIKSLEFEEECEREWRANRERDNNAA